MADQVSPWFLVGMLVENSILPKKQITVLLQPVTGADNVTHNKQQTDVQQEKSVIEEQYPDFTSLNCTFSLVFDYNRLR